MKKLSEYRIFYKNVVGLFKYHGRKFLHDVKFFSKNITLQNFYASKIAEQERYTKNTGRFLPFPRVYTPNYFIPEVADKAIAEIHTELFKEELKTFSVSVQDMIKNVENYDGAADLVQLVNLTEELEILRDKMIKLYYKY